MKFKAICFATAAVMAAPMAAQADATLYGSMRIKMQNLDNQSLNIADNTSRIGIKGSTELYNGMKGLFRFEQALDTEAGALGGGRIGSIGIAGDFGTVLMGKQWTSFALWTILPVHQVDNTTGPLSAGYAARYTREAMIQYFSPKFGGFQFAGAITADSNGNGEDVDTYNLSAKYATGGLAFTASTVGFQDIDANVTAATASYKSDKVYLAARIADDERNVGAESSYVVTGSYAMGNTLLLANYGDDDNEASEEWSVEVRQKLGKQARVFAAYTDQGASDGVEVGYRVDF
ncbi:porin [Pontibacterium sp. N1Y112]|uniref:Porin n=1 Tax=Pontibacterium sinense TaxID=2781979 RepID=A0A8J7JYN8_9GAMM|nr:porin [Pontibacterium sinense]MBE9397818.1 porin [Pontibacterium sinense]